MFDDIKERIIPLTLGELQTLTNKLEAKFSDPLSQVQIVANEERACIKDLKTGMTISWMKRDPQLINNHQ